MAKSSPSPRPPFGEKLEMSIFKLEISQMFSEFRKTMDTQSWNGFKEGKM